MTNGGHEIAVAPPPAKPVKAIEPNGTAVAAPASEALPGNGNNPPASEPAITTAQVEPVSDQTAAAQPTKVDTTAQNGEEIRKKKEKHPHSDGSHIDKEKARQEMEAELAQRETEKAKQKAEKAGEKVEAAEVAEQRVHVQAEQAEQEVAKKEKELDEARKRKAAKEKEEAETHKKAQELEEAKKKADEQAREKDRLAQEALKEAERKKERQVVHPAIDLSDEIGQVTSTLVERYIKRFREKPEGAVRSGLLPLTLATGAELASSWGTIADTLESVSGTAAVATLALSPMMTLVKRAIGENAFSMLARYKLRAEKAGGGLLGATRKLIGGVESRLLGWSVFRETGMRKKLVTLFEKNEDMASYDFRNQDEMDEMVAEGIFMGTTAKMMEAMKVELSAKDRKKVERMVQGHEVARRILLSHYKDELHRAQFLSETLPNRVTAKERSLWMRNATVLAGVGAAKAATLAGAFHALTGAEVKRLLGQAGETGRQIILLAGKAATDVASWVSVGLGGPIVPPPLAFGP